MDALLAEQSARTVGRREMARSHPRLEQVSPGVGALDEEALAGLLAEDLDAGAEVLVDMARATDRELRARVRAVAASLLVPPSRSGAGAERGGARRIRRDAPRGMDLDLDATVSRLLDGPGAQGEDPLRWQGWVSPARAVVLVVDASGSTTGRPLTTAVVTAAALAARLRTGDELAVVAFWSRTVLLRPVSATDAPVSVIGRLLDLRGGDTTDLAGGLRAALGQAGAATAARRDVLVLTDGLANEGDDPLPVAATAAGSGARIHVLALSADADAAAACETLAGVGGGRVAPLLAASQAPAAVAALLDA